MMNFGVKISQITNYTISKKTTKNDVIDGRRLFRRVSLQSLTLVCRFQNFDNDFSYVR